MTGKRWDRKPVVATMGEFDGKLPPHDLALERAVLACALTDPDSGAEELVAIVRPEDFYSEAHRVTWQAVVDLVEAGKIPDFIHVQARLRAKEQLGIVNGGEYLTEIASAACTPTQVLEYAKAVAGKARQRAMMVALHRSIAEAYVGDVDSTEYLAQTIARVEAAGRLEDLDALPMWMDDVVKAELASFRKNSTEVAIAKTGLVDVDEKLFIRAGDLVILAARPGMGKAQSVDELIMTPSGPRRMGDLVAGDLVTGASGEPTRVTGIFERGSLDLFRVTFDDGTFTSCCDDHLWLTRTRSERRRGLPGSVRSTRDIRATLTRDGSGGRNHSIPYCGAVVFDEAAALPVAAYIVGAWLGDGSSSRNAIQLHNSEADVKAMFIDGLCENDTATLTPRSVSATGATRGDTLRVRRVRRTAAPSRTSDALGSLGLRGAKSHTKFVPPAYLRASIADRIALLRGLLDTDGHVDDTGTTVEFSTSSPALAEGVVELVRGLGGSVSSVIRSSAYRQRGALRECRPSHRLRIAFPAGNVIPVSSAKHLARWKAGPSRVSERFIVSVERAGSAICRCISVAAADHLYVTAQGIVTHNTSLAVQAAIATGNALVVSLEMPQGQLGRRSMSTGIGMDFVRAVGQGNDTVVVGKVAEAFKAVRAANVMIVDKPSLSVAQVRAFARYTDRELQKRGKGRLRCVVIDYLQLMRDPETRSRNGNREQEVSEISQGLKALAKDLGIAVIALSQLNRGVESRSDKRPLMSDLRESGAIEQDADKIVFIFNENYYAKKDIGPVVPVEIIVSKQRQGAIGTVTVSWEAQTTTFHNAKSDEYAGDAWS